MLQTIKRLAAAFLIAVLVTGMVPAVNSEAATLRKPENCRFVKWMNNNFNRCLIEWDEVTGADGYQTVISWTDGSHDLWESWDEDTGGIYCYVEDNHVNQVKVRAFVKTASGRQFGPWSNVAYITPSPTKITVSVPNKKKTEAKIKWNTIYGCNGYNVFLTTNPTGTWYWNQSTATNATATSALVKRFRGNKLKTYKNYYYRIVTRRMRNGVFCTVPMPGTSFYSGIIRLVKR